MCVSGIDVKQFPHRNTHSLSLIVFVSDDFCFHSCTLDCTPPPPPPLIPSQSVSLSLALSLSLSLSLSLTSVHCLSFTQMLFSSCSQVCVCVCVCVCGKTRVNECLQHQLNSHSAQGETHTHSLLYSPFIRAFLLLSLQAGFRK